MQEKFNQTHIIPGDWGKFTLNRNIWAQMSNIVTLKDIWHSAFTCTICVSEFWHEISSFLTNRLNIFWPNPAPCAPCSVWCHLYCLCCLKFLKNRKSQKHAQDSCTSLLLLYPLHGKYFLKSYIKTTCFFCKSPLPVRILPALPAGWQHSSLPCCAN